MIRATWNGETIAQSDNAISLEGNYYFPKGDVKSEFLQKSNFHTTCPHKGVASYYNAVVGGEINENAAWYYPEPKEGFEQISDYIAFWNGVEVTES